MSQSFLGFQHQLKHKLVLKMHLRSGRSTIDTFTRALETFTTWPSAECTSLFSTSTLEPLEFESHVYWLLSHATPEDSKSNRLVFMALARSLMNVSHDEVMRVRFRGFSDLVNAKLAR